MTEGPDQPRILGGRYELIEVIGRGGMADVWEGRDIRLGRRVAVKELRSDLARDPSFQARFRREAQSAAALNHPNIVAVYDTGEDALDDGAIAPYIVMEYINGTDVFKMIHAQGKLPVDHALAITAHVCDALAYAHEHGVVHRDIKPANILINMEGAVKVADFGQVKDLERHVAQVTGGITPVYAAPETFDDLLAAPRFVELEIAQHGFADAEMFEQLAGMPRVFGSDDIALAQDAERAERHVLKVPNRRGHEVKRAGSERRQGGVHAENKTE